MAAASEFPASVDASARSLGSALDALAVSTGAQAQALGAALAQVEAHSAELARLRDQLTHAEQRLRHAAQPNYAPRDPDQAQTHRQVCTEVNKWLPSSSFVYHRTAVAIAQYRIVTHFLLFSVPPLFPVRTNALSPVSSLGVSRARAGTTNQDCGAYRAHQAARAARRTRRSVATLA